MATLVLSAVGAAIGSSFGGAAFGLSGLVIGRAIGASIGMAIDQRIMGGGSAVIEQGRVERLRMTGAAEGMPVARLWGRVRVGGHLIWATHFRESVRKRGGGGGGKGRPKTPKVKEYSYSVSVAVALCEGPVLGVGRVWLDGAEIAPGRLNMRLYTGTEDQLPDPLIAAVQGVDQAPAYRGIAYIVFEDLELADYGNRIPQFSFEVMRAAQSDRPGGMSQQVRAVALLPGSGDFVLQPDPVLVHDIAPAMPAPADDPGQPDQGWSGLLPSILTQTRPAEAPLNLNTTTGLPDIVTSLDALGRELPNCESVLLIVSWFGSDLRAGQCSIQPRIEEPLRASGAYPWHVAGRSASDAVPVARLGDRPVYGGTPSDLSVIAAIGELHARGQRVVYYPFILMEVMEGNTLPDPWSGADSQPALPWRGRITTDKAPGQPGSPDGTADAAAEVAAFFGSAQASDFTIQPGQVSYSGPDEWRYRRFILHQAALCAAAGGVDAFCIGSEMRSLTQIRGAANTFPAVAALRALAADVRAILGPDVKLTYAADWSEWFGMITADGDRFFHLDPLWADENIDAIGIDNYMPLSDWRDGADHADAGFGAVHDLEYLRGNVAGGEGAEWFYASDFDRAQQVRSPITDGSDWAEPWIWRYKDIRSWWENPHHDRVGGVRAMQPSPWQPMSKPVWFTEYGCPAIDRGTNQPNVFLDPKSSESFAPYFSRGGRDDLIQMQYVRAVTDYWADPANNPVSAVYGGPMVDMARAHLWAWDARPWPWFPDNQDLWSDGANWTRGHWVTGRATHQPLDAVIAEICARAGLGDVDVSRVQGVVRGYVMASTEAPRVMLQNLMLAYGVDAIERDGVLRFVMRATLPHVPVAPERLVRGADGDLVTIRAPEVEQAGRLRLGYLEAGAEFAQRIDETILPDADNPRASGQDLPLALLADEARAISGRWLIEARIGRDTARFGLPPSSPLGAGDVIDLRAPDGVLSSWRIDRAMQAEGRICDATRIEPDLFDPGALGHAGLTERPVPPVIAPRPVQALLLDLPLAGDDAPDHAPRVAAFARPWAGAVAVHRHMDAQDFTLKALLPGPAQVGVTLDPLARARPGLWDRGPDCRVQMLSGSLQAVTDAAVLGGANLCAIGNGTQWELLQFAGAELVAPDTWAIRQRLRGQQGTDAVMPDIWPAGSVLVMLDDALGVLDLPLDALGVARGYRIGPADLPLDDPAQTDFEASFLGVGLRPWKPAHLRGDRLSGGDVVLRWMRRARRDGDGWGLAEVPLVEASERYRLRIRQGSTLRREVICDAPAFAYTAAMQAADSVTGAFEVEVAQLSDVVGPGYAAQLQVGA